MQADSAKILHHIDQPKFGIPLSRCLILRGWCFSSDHRSLTGVRLRTGDILLAGVIDMLRPDVRAALTSAPHANTGFEIRGVLPLGRNELIIEAQFGDGEWQLLEIKTANVARNRLPLWLGGGTETELICMQMPSHMRHSPLPLKKDLFPKALYARGNQPRLSIVTPSFQQARYVGETMRSVLQQTQVIGEYVIQDGGSTDGSVETIRNLAGDHGSTKSLPSSPALSITSWESAHDAGQADAIARGFAKTSGRPDDLMAWINSDDFYMPGALAFVTDYFARHPDVDVIYGHRVLVDENSQEIGRWFLPKHDSEVLRLNDFVPQETLFWRRRIWEKAGGLDTSFGFAMDWDLLLRFQEAGARIVRVPYFLACFRIHPIQKTSAAMHSTGQNEITKLRERTFRRAFPPTELEKNPRLLRYLRKSAWIEFLWNLGIRAS